MKIIFQIDRIWAEVPKICLPRGNILGRMEQEGECRSDESPHRSLKNEAPADAAGRKDEKTMRKTRWTKAVAGLLCLCMLLSLTPV